MGGYYTGGFTTGHREAAIGAVAATVAGGHKHQGRAYPGRRNCRSADWHRETAADCTRRWRSHCRIPWSRSEPVARNGDAGRAVQHDRRIGRWIDRDIEAAIGERHHNCRWHVTVTTVVVPTGRNVLPLGGLAYDIGQWTANRRSRWGYRRLKLPLEPVEVTVMFVGQFRTDRRIGRWGDRDRKAAIGRIVTIIACAHSLPVVVPTEKRLPLYG